MSTGKIRIYEIAKKIGVSSKELIEKLNKNGFDIKNHMSSVDSSQEKNILGLFELKNKNNKKEDLKASQKTSNIKTDNEKILEKPVVKEEKKGYTESSRRENFSKRINVDSNKVKKENIKKNASLASSKTNESNVKKIELDKKADVNSGRFDDRIKKNFYKRPANVDTQRNNTRDQSDFYKANMSKNDGEKQKFIKSDYRDSRNRNSFYRNDKSNEGQQSQNMNNSFRSRRVYNQENGIYKSNNKQRDNQEFQRTNSDFMKNQRENRGFVRSSNIKAETGHWAKKERSGLNRESQANSNAKDFAERKFFNSKDKADSSNKQIFSKAKTSFGFKNRTANVKTQGTEKTRLVNSEFAKPSQFSGKFNKISNLKLESSSVSEKKAQKSKKEFGNSNRKQKDMNSREEEKEALFYDLQKNKSKSHKHKKNSKKNNKEEIEFVEVSFLRIPNNIVVKELADQIHKPVTELIKLLMAEGLMVNQNQAINFNLASRILSKLNINTELIEKENNTKSKVSVPSGEKLENKSELQPRPPVVVVMGHVDHGKTSLLDAIRDTNVISTEAGGITQHIGAYKVLINGKNITFLDTPGHEAFTAMRRRGAQVTDIAVLVVAADDGIMPQTIEAINHAKAAGVEIIVAINKIDKPGANIEKVKQELTEYDLLCEEWGGQTICVPISAKKRIGIENLLEMIILAAEMKELKANPNEKALGIVIEAKLDKGRGPIATVLVQNGTLKIGNSIVVGKTYGKIRAMIDDRNKHVKQALPSVPVEILGLTSVPSAGEIFYVVNNDKQAKQIAEENINKNKKLFNKDSGSKISLDGLFGQVKAGSIKDLALIIKADVHGSVEALKTSLERLSDSKVKIRVIHSGVGAISESDVMLAAASNAIIIGFNIRPENSAKILADSEKVDIKLYKIIYNAIEDIKLAMQGLLDPVYEEKIIGHAEVRKIFRISKVGMVAGCYVTDGKISRNSKIRVVRDGISIYESEVASLRREKDDVKEVNEGYECGILVDKFNDVKENDTLESYIIEEVKK